MLSWYFNSPLKSIFATNMFDFQSALNQQRKQFSLPSLFLNLAVCMTINGPCFRFLKPCAWGPYNDIRRVSRSRCASLCIPVHPDCCARFHVTSNFFFTKIYIYISDIQEQQKKPQKIKIKKTYRRRTTVRNQATFAAMDIRLRYSSNSFKNIHESSFSLAVRSTSQPRMMFGPNRTIC